MIDVSRPLPRWTILSVTTLSSFMAALDTNIVTIALPAISKGLTSGISLLGWVITSYSLASAALLLQSGKVSDRYGKKRVYLVGFAIFGVSSALCGTSQDIYQLITFRVVQGIGASILSATTYPLIFESFPRSERGSALGLTSGAWSIGSVAGPVLGGILASFDWRLIFYVNVPVSAVAILLGMRRIPDWLNGTGNKGGRMNLLSSGLLAVTVATLILFLTLFNLLLLPIALVAALGLVASELRSKEPLLNRNLLRNKGFVFSALGLSLVMIAYYGVPFAMSFYFQYVRGFSPLLAGIWLAPVPLALILSNPISGRLFDRMHRPGVISAAGAAILVLSTVLLSSAVALPEGLTMGTAMAILLAVVGVSSGMVWAPTLASSLRFSGAELRGIANGTVFTATNIAFATAVAAVISVSASTLTAPLAGQIYLHSFAGLSSSSSTGELFQAGLQRAMLVLAAISLVGLPSLVLVIREQGKHFIPQAKSSDAREAP